MMCAGFVRCRINKWVLTGMLVCTAFVLPAQKKSFEYYQQQLRRHYETKPGLAVAYADSALAALDKSRAHNNVDYAEIYSLKVPALVNLGEYEKALAGATKTLAYAQRSGDKALIAKGYKNIGTVYDYMGQLDAALKYYQKALSGYRKINNVQGISYTVGNIGLVYLAKANYSKSLDYLFESKKMAETLNDSAGMSTAYTNIGLIYHRQANYPKALEYFLKSTVIDERKNKALDMSLDYNNLGSVYMDLNENDKSLQYHKKALAMRMAINNKPGIGNSRHNLGLVYEKLDSLGLAESNFLETHKIYRELNDSILIIEILADLGNFYNNTGRYGLALPYLEEARQRYIAIKHHLRGPQVYQYLSSAYAGIKQFEQAYSYYRRYQYLNDSMHTAQNAKKIIELEISSKYEKQKQLDDFENRQKEISRRAEKERDRIVWICLIGGIVLLVIVALVILRGYNNKKKANELLEHKNDMITRQHEIIQEKNTSITDSIQYAKRLQDAILPGYAELRGMLGECFILYKPKDIVSGDFYWAHQCSDGESVLFAVVDCTGHGVPGSIVSIVAHNALNRCVKEFGLTSPDEILNRTATLVEEFFSKHTGSDIRDGMDVALCLYNRRTHTLAYAGAYNPLWIVGRQDSQLREFQPDKQPIGKFENRKPYTLHTVQVNAGDMVYIFSDGYADQFGGAGGKKFKVTRLKQTLQAIAGHPVQQQKQELDGTLEDWRGNNEQLDDICLMGLRITW